MAIFMAVSVLSEKQIRFISVPKYILIAGEMIMVLSILGDGHFRWHALKDLRFHAGPYHRQLSERYKIIKRNLEEGIYDIQVPSLKGQKPKTIYFNDITEDAADWKNDRYSVFFKANSIVTVPVIEEAADDS